MPDTPMTEAGRPVAIIAADASDEAVAVEAGPVAPSEAGAPVARPADHAAIEALAEDLLPTLIAKLAASGLGELEVRQGDWRVRLRMPARPAQPVPGDRRGGHGRQAAAHGPHGHPGSPADGRAGREGAEGRSGGPGERPPAAVGPGRVEDGGADRSAADGAGHDRGHREVATSPAVGYFEPRRELTSGHRIHEGDRLGTVDVLGIRHDVLSPADGIVGAMLVEPGEAVEYGQDLIRIELAAPPAAFAEAGTASGEAGTAFAAAPAAAAPAAPATPDQAVPAGAGPAAATEPA